MSDHAHPLLSGRIAFSDEQSMLLDSAVTFCRERSPVASVRQLLTTDLGFDRGLWSEIAQLGWSGIAIPERFGGSGLSLGHTAVIAEPMGRHLLATPYVSTQLAIQGLLAGGSAAQQAAWLPRLADGGIGSVALFEDDGDWDLSRPQASATINGASAALQGAKTGVTDAAVADLLLVSVRLDGAPALAVLPTAGLAAGALQRETIIDETRRSYRLVLDGITLPADALITGSAARAALHAIHQAALLLAAAEAAGGIAGVLDVVVTSEKNRPVFEAGMDSFINEARLLAQFDHPSLLKVYRFWQANGTAYMVMPFYEGVTLKERLRQLGGPPDERWLMALLASLTSTTSLPISLFNGVDSGTPSLLLAERVFIIREPSFFSS